MRQASGWRAMLAWAIAVGLAALAVIGAMTIGMFVAPVAVAALVYATLRHHAGRELLVGGLLGVGAACLFVAYRNRGYTPCPPSGTSLRLGPGESYSCGGFDPAPWLGVGLVLVVVGLTGGAVVRGTRRAAS
jgi:hypothetical protein